MCEYRDEILEVIQQIYWLKFNHKSPDAPLLKAFGISAKLGDFCTSEKDLIRNFNRMPTDYYLMDGEKAQGKEDANELEMDTELPDDFFDFEILDKKEIDEAMAPKGKGKKG